MALEVLFFGGYIDGDRPMMSGVADHVAGQPVQIHSDGSLDLCTSTDATTYAGIFKNDNAEDQKAAPQAADAVVTTGAAAEGAGRVVGTNMVRMSPGKLTTGATQTPFVFPGTAHAWVPGDQIFNNASGFWDNQSAGGSVARGRVIKAPASATDDMFVDMYG